MASIRVESVNVNAFNNNNLHMTIKTNESSRAEFGSRGFEPSHFKIVPSSSGIGRNVNVDMDTLPFICCVICFICFKKFK